MADSSTSVNAQPAATGTASPVGTPDKKKRNIDDFEIGECLGEGAYGAVRKNIIITQTSSIDTGGKISTQSSQLWALFLVCHKALHPKAAFYFNIN